MPSFGLNWDLWDYWDRIQDEYIEVLALLCSSSRVAGFKVIFMVQAVVQAKSSSGVGTVGK